MTNVLIKDGKSEVLENLVIYVGADELRGIPRRSYDYNKGDRRFFDQQRAINHANEEARRTGIRQVVRPDSPIPFNHERQRFWLVQAIGS